MRLANLIGCRAGDWPAMTLYGERKNVVRPVLQIAKPQSIAIRLGRANVLREKWDGADETGFDQPCGEHRQSLALFRVEFTQDLLAHLPLLQADRQKDGFHWPGTSHVNCCMGMKFGGQRGDQTPAGLLCSNPSVFRGHYTYLADPCPLLLISSSSDQKAAGGGCDPNSPQAYRQNSDSPKACPYAHGS